MMNYIYSTWSCNVIEKCVIFPGRDECMDMMMQRAWDLCFDHVSAFTHSDDESRLTILANTSYYFSTTFSLLWKRGKRYLPTLPAGYTFYSQH